MAYVSVQCLSVDLAVSLARHALHCMAGFSEINGEEYCLTQSQENIIIKTCKFGKVREKSTFHTFLLFFY